MTISLPPALQALVDERLESGRYHDVEDVLTRALRLLGDQEAEDWLRSAVQAGIDGIDRGEGVPYTPDFMEQAAREAMRRYEAGERPSRDVLP